MNTVTSTPHRCFSRDFLADYQLGKLGIDEMQRVDVEAYSCSVCRTLIESLDEIGDETTEIIAAAQRSTVRAEAPEPPGNTNTISIIDAPASGYQPRRFGQYDLIRPIGQGGMGTVWLANHCSLGRQVAVKLLPINRLICERSQARFFKEISAHGKLSHPNLVQALDAGEIDGIPYLAMELLSGVDAKAFCTVDRLLPITEACALIRGAAEGIRYAHEQGNVHRDVKPSNIRVNADGTVKLLDMGLARLIVQDEDMDDVTAANQILGTIDYMAPEQFCDPSKVDQRADIYSLGCTLFQLLTGRLPFENPNQWGVIAKAVERNSQRAPDVRCFRNEVPRGLAKLVADTLSPEVAKRPQTAAELIGRLVPFCAGADLRRFVECEGVNVEHLAKAHRKPALVFGGAASVFMAVLIMACLFIWNPIEFLDWQLPVAVAQAPAGAENSEPKVNRADLSDPALVASIETAIDKLEVSPSHRTQIKRWLAERPDQSIWIGQFDDGNKAAVVAEKVPPGSGVAFLPDALRAVQARSLHELIRSEASRKLIAQLGYDDPQAADAAIEAAVRGGTVAGHVSPASHLARHQQGVVVSIAIAKHSEIHAAWVTPPTVKAIGSYYRVSLLERIDAALTKKHYEAALVDIDHLLSKPCAIAFDYVSAADCLLSLGREEEAATRLHEALDQSASVNDSDWFVAVGDRLAKIDSDLARQLAEQAFATALKKLQSPSIGQPIER
jgi:serine/threonine protein kinase